MSHRRSSATSYSNDGFDEELSVDGDGSGRPASAHSSFFGDEDDRTHIQRHAAQKPSPIAVVQGERKSSPLPAASPGAASSASMTADFRSTVLEQARSVVAPVLVSRPAANVPVAPPSARTQAEDSYGEDEFGDDAGSVDEEESADAGMQASPPARARYPTVITSVNHNPTPREVAEALSPAALARHESALSVRLPSTAVTSPLVAAVPSPTFLTS
ncbi:MAG: hypothetical protein P4L40_13150, partial [Terracidiphilus sp.]|nr:hypothetical protein [Terracidiphilus sp.]